MNNPGRYEAYLSSTHIATSYQMVAWLNLWSTAPALQRSGSGLFFFSGAVLATTLVALIFGRIVH